MALARAYKIGVFDTATWLAAGATVTTTATTPILVVSINTVTGTKAGGNAVTPLQLSGIAKASLLTAVSTAGGTGAAAITGLTATTSWWSMPVPFTAGW